MNAISLILLTISTASSKPFTQLIPSEITPDSVAIAHLPTHIGTAISKTVHYAETPAITGYTSTLYKPDLSIFGPDQYNYHRTVYRPIQTLIPKIAQIDADIVQVPFIPSIKDIEIASPIFPKVPAIDHDAIHFPSVLANY